MTDNTLARERDINNAIADKKDRLYLRPSMLALFEQQFEALASHIETCGKVAEIGCGTGDFLKRCAALPKIQKLTGIDLSDACVEIARQKAGSDPRTVFVRGDAADVDTLLPEKTDAIVMRGVVHHLEDPAKVFTSCHRALSQGGRLVIFEGNRSSFYRSAVLKTADWCGVEHEASQFTHTPPAHIEKMLAALGYKDIHTGYVPGLVAPLSYTGIGGEGFWRGLMRVNHVAGRVAPRLFGWWYLMTAEK